MTKVLPLFWLLTISSILWADSIKVYFGPNGGFNSGNRNRKITMKNGKKVKATLSNSLVNVLERVEDGGMIKMCMYSMGDMKVLKAMTDAAKNRNVKVKLICDSCSTHGESRRQSILKKIRTAKAEAEKAKKPFDFQVKFIYVKAMEDRGRIRTLKDGKIIYGTMHEKFGILYKKDGKGPFDCFMGSANASTGANNIYAEARIYFQNRPAVARQAQEEFARLWNDYGTAVEGKCEKEPFIPVDPEPKDVRIVFNSEPLPEGTSSKGTNYRIDEELKKLIAQVTPKGSLDIAMFSFTHRGLAQAVLDCARSKPEAKIRILMDQTMMSNSASRLGLMGPWMNRRIVKEDLKNIEIRYKWRSNAYGWKEEKKTVDIQHSLNPLMHHKLMIVNKNLMANGSYNWSDSAEDRNLENVMIFNREFRDHGKVIDCFLAEFNTLWEPLKPEGPTKKAYGKKPQSVTTEMGFALKQKIIPLLEDEKNRTIISLLTKKYFLPLEDLMKASKIEEKEMLERLEALIDATLVAKSKRKKVQGYSLAD